MILLLFGFFFPALFCLLKMLGLKRQIKPKENTQAQRFTHDSTLSQCTKCIHHLITKIR